MIDHDKCSREKCPFSHDPLLVKQARESKIAALVKLNATKEPLLLKKPANNVDSRATLPRQQSTIAGKVFNLHGLLPHLASVNPQDSQIPATKVYVPTCTQGLVSTAKATALLDTGATHASYMSLPYFSAHEEFLRPFTRPVDAVVTLGDNETTKPILCQVCLTVTVTHRTRCYTMDIAFLVYEAATGAADIIIGLPVLCTSGFYLLFDVLLAYREQLLALEYPSDVVTSSNELVLLYDVDNGPYLPPFAKSAVDAPEELLCPCPVSFESYLSFMETPPDVALQTYLEMIPKQCSSDMLGATDLYSLLTTKGKLVFSPTEWHGMSDVEKCTTATKTHSPLDHSTITGSC